MINEIIQMLDGGENAVLSVKKGKGTIKLRVSKSEICNLRDELIKTTLGRVGSSSVKTRSRHSILSECIDGLQCLGCGKKFSAAHGHPVFCKDCFDTTTISERIYSNFIVRRATHPEREE